MPTSLSEDCAVCGKRFKRRGAHLVRSLACGFYYMQRRPDTCSNVSESAAHGTHPNLRSSLYNTLLFWAYSVTVRGEAEDNPPIISVNGVIDEDFANNFACPASMFILVLGRKVIFSGQQLNIQLYFGLSSSLEAQDFHTSRWVSLAILNFNAVLCSACNFYRNACHTIQHRVILVSQSGSIY